MEKPSIKKAKVILKLTAKTRNIKKELKKNLRNLLNALWDVVVRTLGLFRYSLEGFQAISKYSPYKAKQFLTVQIRLLFPER